MKSEDKRKGVILRTIIEAEEQDAEFAELERREWDDPLSPVRKRVDRWSKWLTKRSEPTWGKVIVVDLGSDVITWRPFEPRSLEPNEKVCTAYVYLQRRYGLPSTEALAGKVVESAFMAFSPKEEWEAAGYEVRHKSEADFRMACMFELGWVLKELELRQAPSESGVKDYGLEDDLRAGAEARINQSEGGRQRAANQGVADNGVAEVERRVAKLDGLNNACRHVAKGLGIPWHTLKSRVRAARKRRARKKSD